MVFEIGSKEIKEVIPLKEGAKAYVYDGKHVSKIVDVEEIQEGKNGLATFKEKDGSKHTSLKQYLFAIKTDNVERGFV